VTPAEPTSRRRGVVVAVRRRDGRYLMVRRAACVERAPGKVGLPGGEIEADETPRQAAVREVREELGIAVRPTRQFIDCDLPDRPWRLFGWLADWAGGELKPAPDEVAEVLWLTASEGAVCADGLQTNPAFLAGAERVWRARA